MESRIGSGEQSGQESKAVRTTREDKGDEVASLSLHQNIDFAPAPVYRIASSPQKPRMLPVSPFDFTDQNA